MASWATKVSQVEDSKSGKVGSRRRFGVELEVSRAYNYEQLAYSDIPFGCKRDGSVSNDGREFVSPVLQGNSGLQAVKDLCDYAKENHWEANDTCGFHLHIDLTSDSAEKRSAIIFAYVLTAKLWQAFAHPKRENNSYCQRDLPITLDQCKSMSPFALSRLVPSRYFWLNLHSLAIRNTIEIRLHEGTVDYAIISNWIKAHLRFVDKVSGLTLAEIESRFGGLKSNGVKFRELELIWGDRDISEHYRRLTKEYDQSVVVC